MTARINRIDNSSTVTASGNSGAKNTHGYGQVSFTANVTAISGTSPTIQFGIQASDDASNWNNVHDTRRFTATGAHRISGIRISSEYYRFYWTVAGTSPSVTFTLTSTVKDYSPIRTGSQNSYSDLDLTTLNAVSSSFFAAGNVNIGIIISRANDGVGVGGAVLEASNDTINWGAVSGRINIDLNQNVPVNLQGQAFRYYRVKTSVVTVGGTAASLFWSSTGGS